MAKGKEADSDSTQVSTVSTEDMTDPGELKSVKELDKKVESLSKKPEEEPVEDTEEAKSDEPDWTPPESKKDFDDAVQKQAQSMKDKELVSIYKRIEELEKDKKELQSKRDTEERAKKRTESEKELRSKWSEDGVPEGAISDYLKRSADLDEREVGFKDDWSKAQEEIEKVSERAKKAEAINLAITYGVEGGEEISKQISDFAEQLLDCETLEGMELKAIKLANKKGEKVKPKQTFKPARSTTSGAGGGGKLRLGDFERAKRQAKTPQELIDLMKDKYV